ncbi:MAG: O-antigen ligase family protein [Parcubacteria group bacterium]|nr:O-antigen ligase family protein [Parcubacteria group bacterium]
MKLSRLSFLNRKELWVILGVFLVLSSIFTTSYLNTSISEVLVLLFVGFIIFATLLFPELGLAIMIIPTSFIRLREISGLEILSIKYIIFATILVVTLFRLFHKKEFFKISKPFIFFYLTFAFIIVASLFYTSNVAYGIEKSIEFFTITALAAFVPFFLLNSRDRIKNFFFFLASVGLILGINFILFGVLLSFSKLAEIIGSNYVAVGQLSGMAIIILLYYVKKQKLRYLGIFLAVVILLATMIVSGGKGPIISLILTMIIAAIFSVKLVGGFKKIKIKSVIFIQAIFLIGLVAVLLISPAGSVLLNRTMYFVEVWDQGGETRVDALELSVEMSKESPILGKGMGSFWTEWQKQNSNWDFKYPHNIFLEVSSETGILGLTAFLVIVLWSLWVMIKLKIENYSSRVIEVVFALTIFIVMNSLLSGFINNQALFFYLGMIHSIRLNHIE